MTVMILEVCWQFFIMLRVGLLAARLLLVHFFCCSCIIPILLVYLLMMPKTRLGLLNAVLQISSGPDTQTQIKTENVRNKWSG